MAQTCYAFVGPPVHVASLEDAHVAHHRNCMATVHVDDAPVGVDA